jgi:hypothetical protein
MPKSDYHYHAGSTEIVVSEFKPESNAIIVTVNGAVVYSEGTPPAPTPTVANVPLLSAHPDIHLKKA